jgi:heme A synthase
MTDNTITIRPVPRWVRAWGVATVLVAAAVVVLGGLVTSFRVGMSDPVWPTEPWFLAANGHVWAEEPARGFLIEHTHRLVAWTIGVLATVLAFGAWAAEPNKRLRWYGLAALAVLLVAYLGLHGEMGAAMRARKEGAALRWPVATGAACGVGLFLVLWACLAQVRGGSAGRWVRVVAAVSLVGVMVQGLLGGYRVFLDQLMGTELAAVHGTFAQVVFCLLVAVVVLSAPRRPGDALPAADRARLGPLALAVPAGVFVQLVWGVMLRHTGTPLSQRLHLLTAFVVAGLCVWLAARTLAAPAGRRVLRFDAYHLLGIVGLQILLGVEAWMGKFAAAGPYAALPPELRPVTVGSAAVRTTHVLVGTGLLAAAVVFALRAWRKPVEVTAGVPDWPERTAANLTPEPVAVS